ncbi:hypothetical protein RIF29_22286 [Crotalaria pallida]|uniref:Uncharacterized protein n=1 Tax=Crotalaria pallida TaxID=3830 RepID=A0AAN9F6U4_CROPI
MPDLSKIEWDSMAHQSWGHFLRVEFPFEFRALEVALEAICSFLEARPRDLETAAYPALDELTSKISSRVRKLKSAMTRLTNRVQKNLPGPLAKEVIDNVRELWASFILN